MRKNATAKAEQGSANANQDSTLTVVHIANEENNTVESSETPKAPDEARENQPKSVKEIIEKHQKIARCLEKRQSIDEASKTLDSFNLGSAKMQDVLTIKDGRGNVFTTSKTDLIEEVISFLKNRVEVKTAEVENELLTLETA